MLKISGTRAGILLLLVAAAGVGRTVAAADDSGVTYTRPGEFVWQDVPFFPEVKYQVIAGNPMEHGFYVIRSKFPPGVMTRPHHHSRERWITVISGTFYAGNEPVADPDKMIANPPGTSIHQKAGAIHFDGAKEEEVIVEIMGMGPVTTTFPDEQVEPVRHRIVLIGATANSAGELISQALAAGHEVIGVSRNPDELKVDHESFEAVRGDVYEVESIEAILTGEEVVISYIDVDYPFGAEIPPGIDLFSRGTANIIKAMKEKGNRRLMVTSNIAAENIVLDPPGQGASMSDRLGWARRYKYADVRLMETIIEASELDYIILRLPHLVPGPPTGQVNVVVNANSHNRAIRDSRPPRNLTLADLSAFILQQLDSDEYLGQRLGLFN